MEEKTHNFVVAGFTFTSNFDSGNLARVELINRKVAVSPPVVKTTKKVQNAAANAKPTPAKPVVEVPDYEFNLWTKPDCSGTEFENSNRTWFYFGIRGGPPSVLVKLNIVDLNKQGRMYREGMAPVCRIVPGRNWERIRDKPLYSLDNNIFTLSFKFRSLENDSQTIYFAFTYPFTYAELQNSLDSIDSKMCRTENIVPQTDIRFSKGLKIVSNPEDTIYYRRELACFSLDGRRIDLITISSHHNITHEREPRLRCLFPLEAEPRCVKFRDKKVVFLSARVHPGETPSSFVLNGLLNLLLSRDDPIALLLRRYFVFKIIPMLNPDGVARGHYRTDTRGVNLNRFYLQPVFHLHPSIFAARSLIRYYHYSDEIFDDTCCIDRSEPVSQSDGTCFDHLSSSTESLPLQDLSIKGCRSSTETLPLQNLSLKSSRSSLSSESGCSGADTNISEEDISEKKSLKPNEVRNNNKRQVKNSLNELVNQQISLLKEPLPSTEHTFADSSTPSGLFLYLDMHGHASKKGIFMYGNHHPRLEDNVECMLFPKILSINSQHFHFSSCNFTERNMYLRDKRDGTSREGSGRVAVLRLTGNCHSYTLECNYNTGRALNILPQCSREPPGRASPILLSPPKYSPAIYEEVGRSIGFSLLDLINANPWSRIPNSEFHTMNGIREWLHARTYPEYFHYQRQAAENMMKRQSQLKEDFKVYKKSQKSSINKLPVSMALRPSRIGSKSSVRLTPLSAKSNDLSESFSAEFEKIAAKESSSVVVNQLRAGSIRLGNIYAKSLRVPEKPSKFKLTPKTSEDCENEKKVLSNVSIGLNWPDTSLKARPSASGEPCSLKQGPKRLKISKGDGETRIKKQERKKEIVETPSDTTLFSKIPRPLASPAEQLGTRSETLSSTSVNIRVLKPRPQLSPLKYKKSLEKRRNSDVNRKKNKLLSKKASKLSMGSDLSKGERKRKKK